MILSATDRPIAFTMETGSPTQRVEPITLDWAKSHLRFPSSSEDTLLIAYRAAARQYFEEMTGRQCINAEWEYAVDGPPDQSAIELPRPPLVSVTAVVYDDADGVEQTFASDNYRVIPSYAAPNTGSPTDPIVFDPYCPPGRIQLVSGATWPTCRTGAASLRIRRTCGYGATADDMPPLLQNTVAVLMQHFHNRSGDDLPIAVDTLIHGFKWSAVPTCRPSRWCTYPTASTITSVVCDFPF